ncbi:MAG: tRNA(Ile)-lysidine synthase [Gemmatimonadetes bacterium]|jgi:tRNA(Ile)-lysidine synthase|nr:tRNA(Ile)-lysidine synthase [Gemmatimonadota bacterium]
MHHDPACAVHHAARRAAQSADTPLLLAVSGGLDSMALMRAMSAVASDRIAAVATFDHGTGAVARAAVRHVDEVASARGLTVVVGRMDATSSAPEGREAAWRAARHAFLRETAAPFGARVTTAHTEDDQIETVLMRIMRGSGARGLAGLYADGPIVRPFVELRRSALEAYMASAQQSWVEDPSNASPEFTRNRMRHDLAPALRRADPGIDAWVIALARRAATLRRDVEEFVSATVRPDVRKEGRLVVASRELAGYDRDSLAVLWSSLAGRAGLALDRRGTRRIAEFTISQPRCGSIPLAGGWRLEATRDSYLLHKAVATTSASATPLPQHGSLDWGRFRFRVSSFAEHDSPWTAAIPCTGASLVRAWSAGDRLEPAAGQRRRRVRRYLSDVGVQGGDRTGWPVVVSGDDVLWIPGVRRSDAATDRSGRPVRHYVCERIDR